MTPAQYNEYQRMADVIDEAKKLDEQSKYFISDEEIEKEADKRFPNTHQKKEMIKFISFCDGAKWYRKQLNKK